MVEEIRKDENAKIITEQGMMFWGDLKARIQDPFGYIWDLAEKAS